MDLRCVYCDALEPSSEHLESHNHENCENKGIEARTFYRKDHLRQHLRLMHDCELIGNMDSWKSSITHLNSRCGFCTQTFTVWQERVDHLAKHFRDGAQMKDWKGCRGLDPAVAAQVTRAMPPYLIGQEAVSPIPFSATNATSLKCCMNYEPESISQHFETFPDCPSPRNTQKMTCWEILTVRLGRFAMEKLAQGVTPSDEMLQDHARRLLYDNDDPWNQTAADNPDWLNLFKKAHGLNFQGDAADAGQGRGVLRADGMLQECEKWNDLELNLPMSVFGNFPVTPLEINEGLVHPTGSNHGNVSDFPDASQEPEEFDFDQIFTTMPEAETFPDADIALDEALIHGLDG
ncbi:MAG: hypothetical protein M1822_005974 [Bathelium mastoideum]|nr:MAG: hypothetical protein M1822_005974 [Bathelium mastoideum]